MLDPNRVPPWLFLQLMKITFQDDDIKAGMIMYIRCGLVGDHTGITGLGGLRVRPSIDVVDEPYLLRHVVLKQQFLSTMC